MWNAWTWPAITFVFLSLVGGFVRDRYLWSFCGSLGRAVQRIPWHRWDFQSVTLCLKWKPIQHFLLFFILGLYAKIIKVFLLTFCIFRTKNNFLGSFYVCYKDDQTQHKLVVDSSCESEYTDLFMFVKFRHIFMLSWQKKELVECKILKRV